MTDQYEVAVWGERLREEIPAPETTHDLRALLREIDRAERQAKK